MYRYHNSDFFFPRLGFSSRMLGFRDPFEDFFTTPLLHNDIDTALSDLWTDFGVLTPHARHRNVAPITPAHLTNQNATNNSNSSTKHDAEQDPTAKEESQHQLEHKGLEQKGDTSQLNPDQQQKQEKQQQQHQQEQQQQQQQQAMVHHTGSDWLQSYLRAPNVEVIAKENEFLVNVDVPGVRKEDVKVNITEDARGRKMLNISGERRDQTSQEDKERGYTVTTTSRMYGKFSRSLLLPDGASMEGVKAKQENGVLSVSVPRVAVKPKMSAMDIDVQ